MRKTKLYLVVVRDGTHAVLHGPFDRAQERDEVACDAVADEETPFSVNLSPFDVTTTDEHLTVTLGECRADLKS